MLAREKEQILSLNNCHKEQILNYLSTAWETEDLLFQSIISPATFYLNPDSLRNPLIFYLGHSAVFYLNKLVIVGLLTEAQRINPHYEKLYEMGVDPQTPEELQNAIASTQWDSVEELWQYRQLAYQIIIETIEKTPLSLPITPDNPWWAIIMGIEHQRIHIETSSMLIRQLPCHLLKKPLSWHYASSLGKPPANQMIAINGGIVTLGKKENDFLYGWDIDFGSREVQVAPFCVSQYMITNAEYLEFVQAGGYQNQEFWQDEAWQWKQENQVDCPKFWQQEGNQYLYRLMFDLIDLPLDFPVEVNHYEAMAYCSYLSQKQGKNFGLMTEAQWHLARQKSTEQITDYNLNLRYISPHPVGSIATSQSDRQVYDLRGNVWEWLADIFTPLSGFKPHYLYEDYSAPFFDNRHHLLVGGAWATNGYEATPFYRNWFRPYFYQHAGFRVMTNCS